MSLGGRRVRAGKPTPPPSPSSKLEEVRNRRKLLAAYVDGWEGPGFNNGPPHYKGYACDYVRFYTVAVLSGQGYDDRLLRLPNKYWEFVYGPDGDSRQTLLQNDQVDVVDCQTTMTLTREGSWGAFTATTVYDGGSLMYNTDYNDPITSLGQLQTGQKIGFESPTTADGYIPPLKDLYGIDFVRYAGDADNNPENLPLFYDEALADLASGKIDFIASDETWLRSLRVFYDGDYDSIAKWGVAANGPLALSEEPLTPMTKGDDEQWTSIIKWCVYATFLATQLEINRPHDVDWHYINGFPEAKSLLGAEPDGDGIYLPEKIGLDRHAFRNAIKVVGAWDEIWDRSLAALAPIGLNLPRGDPNEIPPNGLFFSPVFG
jgi:ABC-type amino acid transport substrate-binding protein